MSGKSCSWLLMILVIAPMMFTTLPAGAAGNEFRLKLDTDYEVIKAGAFTLRPMVRTEQRFRGKGLVLLKIFAGFRMDLARWLKIQVYYAHKDKMYKDHQIWHMAVIDLIFHYRFGPLSISDRNGNEIFVMSHSASYFYRYRNNLDLHLNPHLGWLRLWVADEIRVDVDEKRMNMNDAKAGADLLLGRPFFFRLYYDLESKRRGKPKWVNTNVFQLMLIMRFG
ncbi:MAG: hypothetical protein GXP49_02370 [Deltaproteobacteria bacterium]|nr:hypothetical protein [Deltaproteobacteria bacterium]